MCLSYVVACLPCKLTNWSFFHAIGATRYTLPASKAKPKRGRGPHTPGRGKRGKGICFLPSSSPFFLVPFEKFPRPSPFQVWIQQLWDFPFCLISEKQLTKSYLNGRMHHFFAVRAKKYLVNFVPLFQESIASSLNCRYPCLRALGQVGRGGGGTLVWSDWLTTAGDRLGKKLI